VRDRRLDRDLSREPEAVLREAEAEAAADVLALQRTAGNHAVSRMLARQPSPKEDRAATMTAGLGDDIGVIPIDAFGWPAGNPGAVGSGESTVHEVTISFESNAAAPAIAQYVAQGRPIPKAFISTQKVTFDLTDVVLSNYQESGHGTSRDGTITVTLNFAGIELRPVR
jgi:hypothetical protein